MTDAERDGAIVPDDTDDDANDMKHPHEHAAGAGAPGASGPGDPGFDGDVQIGDE